MTEKSDSVAGMRCWVLTDGKAGMENQCLGLAEALGLEPEIKRVAPRFPWRLLTPHLWFGALWAPGPGGDRLTPPWPDLLIGSGRQAVALSTAIKRRSGNRTFTVQIQNPVVPAGRFDLVATPRHDRLTGDNVIVTEGALHRVTPERLAAEAERFRDRLAGLGRPLVAVLIGGSNRQFRMTRRSTESLVERLAQVVRKHGAGLAVTASRRTGADNEAMLRDRLAGLPAEIWDGTGDNPYFGYLGLADAVVVTGDSVSMVSEACATGKPVYVFDLEGKSDKFRRFHENLRERGFTRPFEGGLDSWNYAPLQDTARVADEIRRRIAAAAPNAG
jgi:uncharacterized protein